MPSCRSCNAEIIWGRTADGKPFPLNPDPTPDGNVLLEGERVRVIGGTERHLAEQMGEDLYLSHFATCPAAREWRRRRGRR